MPLHRLSPHCEVLEVVSGNSLSKRQPAMPWHHTFLSTCQTQEEPTLFARKTGVPQPKQNVVQFWQFTHLHPYFTKQHTIPVGKADSNRLNHASNMKWRMESHLRDGNVLRNSSCLCRHKSSSSWLSRLPQRQSSDHDSCRGIVLGKVRIELVVNSYMVASLGN